MDATAIDSEDFPLMKANNKACQEANEDHTKYVSENSTLHGHGHRHRRNELQIYNPNMEYKYQHIWYELGAPIAFPLVKFIFSIVLWILENFFLIMNTLNAIWIREGNSPELKRERILIASLTIGFHVASCVIISFIDSLNKVTISGKAWSESKRFAIFRVFAHVTLTMKFLRYFSAYLDNRKKNKKILLIRKQRLPFSEEEIQFVVDIKKNDLVDCHYDVIEIFFKNVPAALLQVFLMFQTSPAVRLKLTTRLDIYRFLTVFFTIISGAALTANYQLSYNKYKKVLHFQDCFRTNFKHKMNLSLFGGANIIILFCNQLTSIGIRICFFALIIFWNPNAFLIVLPSLLLAEWIIAYVWCRSSWRFRPILENPLYGLPWLSFELIDAWINLYSPGVHYLKFMHHFVSTCVLNGIALCVFQGFATIITPVGSGNTTLLERKVPNYTENPKSSLLDLYNHLNNMFNCTAAANGSPSDEAKENFAEDEYFIGSAIKIMLHLHEYITLNEIPYVFFFFYVVKFMNVVALGSFLHICYLNFYNKFDLDFPIQIAHDFYVTIFKNLQFTPSITKKFLLVSLLSNRDFFSLFYKWERVRLAGIDEDVAKYEKLLKKVMTSPESKVIVQDSEPPKKCWASHPKWKLVKLSLKRLFSPESLRIADVHWKNNVSKEFIIRSVEHHLLFKYMHDNLINYVYDDSDEQTKLMLSIFCQNFDLLLKHTTSFRIQKTFYLLGLKVEKGCAVRESIGKSCQDVVDGTCKRDIWDIIVKDFVEI